MVEMLPKAILEAADVSAVSQLILRERAVRPIFGPRRARVFRPGHDGGLAAPP